MDAEIDDTDPQRHRRRPPGHQPQGDHVQSLTFKHLLLPIWLLTVIYAGKPFQVFINGITGEVQGQRPWSKVKIAVAVMVVVILRRRAI